jgi:hypothetical protein
MKNEENILLGLMFLLGVLLIHISYTTSMEFISPSLGISGIFLIMGSIFIKLITSESWRATNSF